MGATYWMDGGPDDKPTLRRSQAVNVFGVGAIVDLPDASVMVCGIDRWDMQNATSLIDQRLARQLQVYNFKMPPDTKQSADGIRVTRFPKWLRCRKCGSLRPSEVWRELSEKSHPKRDYHKKPLCPTCSVPLIPSRFVVACSHGHIDDFPYAEWGHGGKEKLCSNPDMKFSESGRSATLAGIYISCRNCSKGRNMRGAFDKEELGKVRKCTGSKPWAGKKDDCGEDPVCLLRGGTNVHFPETRSSILIPPFTSDKLKEKITSTDTWQGYESQEGAMDRDMIIQIIANALKEPVDDIRDAITEMEEGVENKDERSEEDYRFDEYRAFLGDVFREKDFEIEPVSPDGYGIPHLKSLVLVKKLRELRVQTGFSRIQPRGQSDEPGEDVEPEYQAQSVTEDRTIRWLPGYEVRGEGIFMEFDHDALAKWASRDEVRKRAGLLTDRFKKHPDAFSAVEMMTPEYLLLHTLSHLLIRQLSFECGYGSSALRERVYCSSDQSKRKMAGMLIYTADGDSEGTMGGLVRQGDSRFLPRTFYEAVTSAEWCSSDPLCIESAGQGYQSMNLAACHACAMLPETSCESMNRYVDRGMVVGTLANPGMGLFRDWADQVARSQQSA